VWDNADIDQSLTVLTAHQWVSWHLSVGHTITIYAISLSVSLPLSLSLSPSLSLSRSGWLSLSPDFFGKRVGLSTSQALYITIDSSNAHHQEHDLSIHSHPSNGLPFRALLGLKCRTPMDPTTIAFFIQLPATGIILDDFLGSLGSLGSFYDSCWGILQNPTVAPNQLKKRQVAMSAMLAACFRVKAPQSRDLWSARLSA